MHPLQRIVMKIEEVILGVDTHLNVHVGALISNSGKCLGTLSVTTDAAGYLKLISRS
jgi:transposase